MPRLLLLARELLGQTEYDRFRANIETRLKEEKLDPLRDCLDEAYAQVGGIDGVKQVLEQCRFDERMEEVAVCTEALLSGLYEMTAADGPVAGEIGEERRRELGDEVTQACS